MTSDSDLDYLSQVSGVDFHSLKAKYSGNVYKKDKNAYVTSSNKNGNSSSIQKETPISEEKSKEINATLSQYHICKACNGLGIIKTLYNHMMLEKTCEECDGDSIILQSNMEKAVASIHPIDDR